MISIAKSNDESLNEKFISAFASYLNFCIIISCNIESREGKSDPVNVIGTDNQEKDEKQSQNDKTGLGMEKTVKDKAKSKPESQSSQKVNRKVNWSKSKSTQVNPGAKVQEI
ncbi:hypothetical protein Tco_1390794 [Tanacetum coccineum]